MPTVTFCEGGATPPDCPLNVSGEGGVNVIAGQFEQTAVVVPLIPNVVGAPPANAYVPLLALFVVTIFAENPRGIGETNVFGGKATVDWNVELKIKLQLLRPRVAPTPFTAGFSTVTVEDAAVHCNCCGGFPAAMVTVRPL